MYTINLDKLKSMAVQYPEIKRLCTMKVPVYLLNMELERYNMKLDSIHYKELDKLRLHFTKR